MCYWLTVSIVLSGLDSSQEYWPELEYKQTSRGDRYCHPVICDSEPIAVENSVNDWIKYKVYHKNSIIT